MRVTPSRQVSDRPIRASAGRGPQDSPGLAAPGPGARREVSLAATTGNPGPRRAVGPRPIASTNCCAARRPRAGLPGAVGIGITDSCKTSLQHFDQAKAVASIVEAAAVLNERKPNLRIAAAKGFNMLSRTCSWVDNMHDVGVDPPDVVHPVAIDGKHNGICKASGTVLGLGRIRGHAVHLTGTAGRGGEHTRSDTFSVPQPVSGPFSVIIIMSVTPINFFIRAKETLVNELGNRAGWSKNGR